MEDFNKFVEENADKQNFTEDNYPDKNLFNLINSVAMKFNGKNQNELLMAIYKEAEKGKRAGTLTNSDIDKFSSMLAPMLDDKKCKILYKLTEELKKI